MKDRPDGVTDADIRAALAAGWGLDATDIRYLPVGAGSYHWVAGDRWFVTVDGLGFADSFTPLRTALETATALRRAGLRFVVAPIDGPQVLWPLRSTHAVAVYPLIDGHTDGFGDGHANREAVIDLIAALHQARPTGADVTDLQLPGRAGLEKALDDLEKPWSTGPYADSARALLTTHADKVRTWLADYDRMAGALRETTADWVITHGEPHPANVLHTATGPLLIDWDTVRIAPPERDLWHLAKDPFAPDPADLTRWAATTGREPSPTGLAFYRLSWILADVASYVHDLRGPHGAGGDAEDALTYLAVNITMP
ncbi:phosphotransferase [Paractinoplanes durhamensis]|uniref:Aminoglycoside phosphotransferase domain-containing protein n=1 Tax=Paractinoplanes durhamensis TaxID=113563 RepID=A0ABQ3YQL0_9ACTN|nr:phosphotransferase [Actinoplanes durhamensis]GID99813.1 hypothetical protein Adu01nite_11640 [Actinoplanes durhamensis]